MSHQLYLNIFHFIDTIAIFIVASTTFPVHVAYVI